MFLCYSASQPTVKREELQQLDAVRERFQSRDDFDTTAPLGEPSVLYPRVSRRVDPEMVARQRARQEKRAKLVRTGEAILSSTWRDIANITRASSAGAAPVTPSTPSATALDASGAMSATTPAGAATPAGFGAPFTPSGAPFTPGGAKTPSSRGKPTVSKAELRRQLMAVEGGIVTKLLDYEAALRCVTQRAVP